MERLLAWITFFVYIYAKWKSITIGISNCFVSPKLINTLSVKIVYFFSFAYLYSFPVNTEHNFWNEFQTNDVSFL